MKRPTLTVILLVIAIAGTTSYASTGVDGFSNILIGGKGDPAQPMVGQGVPTELAYDDMPESIRNCSSCRARWKEMIDAQSAAKVRTASIEDDNNLGQVKDGNH